MKRTLLIFFILFIIVQLIQTEQSNTAINKSKEIQAPKNIMSLLKVSCYDCHSNEVNWPWYSNIAPFSWIISEHVNTGREWLNFSVWENYTEEEKNKKMKAIYRTVYALMPLQSYIWLHKEADLTKEQRELIREWTGVRKRK